MKYRGEIDGLRAVAVLSVVFFHAGFPFFRGGYVGVDIFFVISGYLITGILISDIEAGRFSIKSFYERRARRLLPALFFVSLISIPFAVLLLPPSEFVSFSRSLVATSLFYSNFFFASDGGYFETAAELKPLLHTWSLAVEEQYYIVAPVFLIALWKFGSSTVLKATLVIAFLSLCVAQVWSTIDPVDNFFLLPGRIWEISLGAVVVLLSLKVDDRKQSGFVAELASLCGICLIVFSVLWFDHDIPFPSVYTLLPTSGAALVIAFARDGTMVHRLLNTRALIWVGLISYSLYLWHQPVLAFARYAQPIVGDIHVALLLILIACLAYLTWKFVEEPFRRNRDIGRARVYSISLIGIVFFACLGTLVSRSVVGFGEAQMAKELSSSPAIYTANMDERKFVRSRVHLENMEPDVIVLGSSRVMQIGSHNLGTDVLNLAVSGASVEDLVAISQMASKKFEPSSILIGIDPWLFNSKSKQNRWRTLSAEYRSGMQELGIMLGEALLSDGRQAVDTENVVAQMYDYFNVSTFSAVDDEPEYLSKIRRDGSRVYDIYYANKDRLSVEKGALEFASYAMEPFEFSDQNRELLSRLISHLSRRQRVTLVLSPYHPALYQFMADHDRKFLNIEKISRDLAAELNVKLIGSYDPKVAGCGADEFYDGMHPKDSCMEKVFASRLM